MKCHHCHCGLEQHLKCFQTKRFGLLGLLFVIGHILFHVVECLIVPAILVAAGGHAVEERAAAAEQSVVTNLNDTDGLGPDTTTLELLSFQDSLWPAVESISNY